MPVVTARLEARISPDLQKMLKRAAEIEGRTLTDFVVTAVQDAAQRTIEQAGVIRLSLADQQRLVEALLSPPDSTPALKRAMVRHDKLLRTEENGKRYAHTQSSYSAKETNIFPNIERSITISIF